MGLLTKSNKYVKMSSFGNFEIYPSEEARLRVKNAPSTEEIKNKYKEIIAEKEKVFKETAELAGFDLDNYESWSEEQMKIYETFIKDNEELEELTAWSNEYFNYTSDIHFNRDASSEYPLISTIYPNAKDSLCHRDEIGSLPTEEEDVKKVYERVKDHKNFGETKDV